MLTEKENFLILLRGECPEWVPNYSILLDKADSRFAHSPACMILTPPFINEHRKFGVGGTDIWGVRYVPTEEPAGRRCPSQVLI